MYIFDFKLDVLKNGLLSRLFWPSHHKGFAYCLYVSF